MKPARLAVLGLAIAAGGTAAFLASRPEAPQQVVVAPPPAPVSTVDVLVAKKDIGVGQALLPQDIEWVSWPASASNPAFVRSRSWCGKFSYSNIIQHFHRDSRNGPPAGRSR